MNIIPTPKKVLFALDNAEMLSFAPIVKENTEFACAIDTFAAYVDRMYNLALEIKGEAIITIDKDCAIPAEAYKLEVGKKEIIIRASDNVGVNHAFATILQIMETDGISILIPAVTIEDKPDSEYRGMLVDLGRNWHPFDYLLTYVDMCYFYKVSVLHLHFTENESYTLPSELYPNLSTKDRSYTKEQIHELVEYANARGVQLMPEIDVPGHCKSFGEGYGELFGTKGVICQHADSMEAMRNLFRELCDMFPYSKYIHIGGDEVYAMEEWTKCPQCCEYAKSVDIDSDMEDKGRLADLLYAHFISEMAEVCFEKGRQPIVWEGFGKSVNDKISKDIWVMSWENYYQLTPELLENGFKVINCSWVPNYIVTPILMWNPEEVFNWSIYTWTARHEKSPILETGYQCQPGTAVLGGQLHGWGDAISLEFKDIEEGVREERKNLLERLPMLAENTWNVEKVTDYASFEKTVQVLHAKLVRLLD